MKRGTKSCSAQLADTVFGPASRAAERCPITLFGIRNKSENLASAPSCPRIVRRRSHGGAFVPRKLPIIALLTIALTALTCLGIRHITPSAPCDLQEMTLIALGWILILVFSFAAWKWLLGRRNP